MMTREAFGMRLNNPSLNTHVYTCVHTCREVRTNNHFTLVLIRGHLVTICSSWLRQKGKFVL